MTVIPNRPTTAIKPSTRDGILRAGLVALVEHIADYQLSVPMSIDLPRLPEDTPRIRVRLAGIGQQTAWLNTVEVVSEVNEQTLGVDAGYVRTTWVVALPETLTRVEFVGLRPRALVLTSVAVSA